MPEPTIAAGAARHGLGELVLARRPETKAVVLHEPPADAAGANGLRQLVLVLRDAHRHAWEREAAEAILASARDAIVVDVGVPVWRPSGAAGYLVTYGAGRANLAAAAERLYP